MTGEMTKDEISGELCTVDACTLSGAGFSCSDEMSFALSVRLEVSCVMACSSFNDSVSIER